MQALLLIAAITAIAPSENRPIQSANGEFIFSQYPPRAKAAGEQGSVRFQTEVDAKGNVMSCKVTQGSGHMHLDRETCDLIVDHASFKPTLDSEGRARAVTHDGIVNWRLPGRSPPREKIALGGRALDEVVCKRSAKTGSLVVSSRVCMTRREWTAQAQKNQDDWSSMQGRQGFGLCPVDPETKVLLC
jgi:periplasmic protein TonB